MMMFAGIFVVLAVAAQTVARVRVARDVAIDGLHHMWDVRARMGEPEGPPLPEQGR